MNTNYDDWQIGLIPHIPGFPLPVVGLAAPSSHWQGMISLHIASDVALHVSAAEVVLQPTRYADFLRLSGESTLGQTVETALSSQGTVNPFDRVALTSYCVSKGFSAQTDVDRAARLIRDAYRELARQIQAQNQARLN